MKKVLILLLASCIYNLKSQHQDFNTLNKEPLTLHPHPNNDRNWDLIFEDNFNTLNRAVWSVADGPNLSFTSMCMFRDNPTNIFVSNGTLKLRATGTPYLGRPFTGALINSIQNFNLNTYIEASVKIQPTPGSFPAFWLWRDVDGCLTNSYNEIDILEYFGCWQNAFNTAIHYCINGDRAAQGNFLYNTNIDNGTFHTFSILWQRDNIYHCFDNIKFKIQPNNNIIQFAMPLIFNQAVNSPSCTNPSLTPPTTSFPITTEVDWVRVYQLRCDRNSIVTQISNFNTFNFAVKRSYSLSNTTIIPPNQNVSLIARDFVQFNNGFEVPTTSNLSVSNIDCQ